MYLKKQQQNKAKTKKKKKKERKKDREKKEGVLSRIRTLHHRLHATSLYHYLSTTKDEKEHSFQGPGIFHKTLTSSPVGWQVTAISRLYRSRHDKEQLKLLLWKQLSTKPTRQLMKFAWRTETWSLLSHNAILYSWWSFSLSCTSFLKFWICKSLSVII